eukprot:TRINITY_DN1664_c0_g1_i1.p1 TRINITY_DN1664_c0_g1~~TRINITY_DN1664_c0_g1_i1.p1  ORF type:complete len:578 (+),score=143.71 TRINITY_DN1664_c0_g1_i1:1832-3565(+)
MQYQMWDDFKIDIFTSKSTYAAIEEYSKISDGSHRDEKRLIDTYLSDFQRNGCFLDEAGLSKVVEKTKTINEICSKYNANIYAFDGTIEFTLEELEGLPEDNLANLKQTEDGKYEVTSDYPIIGPIFIHCNNSETRRKCSLFKGNMCGSENAELFNELLVIRQETAELLGFESNAEYELDITIAKTKENVLNFLTKLHGATNDMNQRDMAELQALKSEYTGTDEPLQYWDIAYYQDKLKKQKFHIDSEEVKKYFPRLRVVEKVMEIYSDILDLQIEMVDHSDSWHEDVAKYQVLKDGDLIGYFYLDLFPRDGKYSHAACFPVHIGYTDSDTEVRHVPISAMVANLAAPTDERDSLLRFSEVKTFFHEFGHVMHSICSDSLYYRLNWSWKAVEQDFLEVPSLMIEHFVYNEDIMNIISGHYENNSPLPSDILSNIVEASQFGKAYTTNGTIFRAEFDILVHSSNYSDSKEELIQLYSDIKQKYLKMEVEEPTIAYASWNHLTSGYNSGYYCYLWAEGYAKDMFEFYKGQGLLNKEVGVALREKILEPCATLPGEVMLNNFLGRPPSMQTFFDYFKLEK